MKPWLKWTAAGLVLALLAAGTLRTINAHKAKEAALLAEQAAQKAEPTLELRPGDVLTAHTQNLTLTLPIAGPINALRTALVKARVPGELQGLVVREGDSVRAGQVLARIDPTESQARLRQARQQAQAAQAQVEIAQRNYDNNRALVAQGFISSTALQSSQATLDAARASHAAAQSGVDLARKALDDAVLRAPIDGQISQRLAEPGERVAVDTRIVEIVDNRRLELQANVSAADSLQVRVGQEATLQVEGSGQPVQAQVARINPSASAASRAVQVYLSLAPAPGLRQGLYAQGLLATGTVHAVTVPLDAVLTDKPQPYVQVIRESRVRHQPVQVRTRSVQARQTLVALEGLADGAQVLAGSVGALRDGTQVRITTDPGVR